ncbi:hypothetical protein H072_697 [Dactylellina haptotyla CBS 200.50]|uniref:G domain-containing protein n=1 Tax=Dactylellina haptotyla (strain CBS 200.50) TaxID=1284197 RepID=S8AWI0_DACHA|nr:hypothetical protein H072_697 [Dactylellina haptotyla CBS 200.50]
MTYPQGLRDPRPGDIIIVVMGTTGVGKSTFISYATGQNVKVGNTLEACTSKTGMYQIPNSNIYLVDTPGFDDTYVSDKDILEGISDCLRECVSDGLKVSGILYVHPITEARMKGSAMKNLRMFRKVMGDGNMGQCCLLTTKWSLQPREKSEDFEHQLKTNPHFWKLLIDQGASIARFGDSQPSAMQIIYPLAKKSGFVPQLTKEINEGKTLGETEAGIEVLDNIEEAKKKHEEEKRELQKDYEEALRNRDKKLAQMIAEEKQRVEKEINEMRAAQEELRKKRDDDYETFQREIASERQGRKRDKERRTNRIGRWVVRGATVAIGVGATVATAGLAAPLAVAAYGFVEAAAQEQKERE